ncbi:hypothetical protein CB1_000274001 [Camelus ferus]|nr:hypothetical protein CB1_000274001 [Camelus ferus]
MDVLLFLEDLPPLLPLCLGGLSDGLGSPFPAPSSWTRAKTRYCEGDSETLINPLSQVSPRLALQESLRLGVPPASSRTCRAGVSLCCPTPIRFYGIDLDQVCVRERFSGLKPVFLLKPVGLQQVCARERF